MLRKYLGLAICLALATQPAIAAWVVKDQTSQLDNSRFYSANLASSNTMPNSIGAADNATLVVRCKAGELSVYIVWPAFMGTDSQEVRWKFDAGQVWKQIWNNSEDGTATFARDQREFLNDIGKSSKLVVDAYPYQQENIEAVFDLVGADAIARDALSACPT